MQIETILYWLPHCDTCKKAKKFLDAKGIQIDKLRNIKEDRLSPDEIDKLSAIFSSADAFFSKKAIKYRQMGLNKREVSEDEMLQLIKDEYTFIKRPVLIRNGKGIAGFSEKSYEAFLEGK
jgi:arsenate reductase (glutaredoxin)